MQWRNIFIYVDLETGEKITMGKEYIKEHYQEVRKTVKYTFNATRTMGTATRTIELKRKDAEQGKLKFGG